MQINKQSEENTNRQETAQDSNHNEQQSNMKKSMCSNIDTPEKLSSQEEFNHQDFNNSNSIDIED